jgi:hypothetical protein
LLSDAAPEPAPPEREPDLADYGLPRLLICQREDTARMLVANEFHMEAVCAVLGARAASPVPDTVRAMLGRTPGARVYLLHDASPEGLAFAAGFGSEAGLPDGVPVTPLGVRPSHAWRMHLFASRGALSVAETPCWPVYLTPRERAWLEAGWRAEAASIAPARLLRALRRILLGPVSAPARPGSYRNLGFMTWPE